MSTINDIIWCMIPGIFNVTDQIFCYFGPFFALLPPPLKTKKIKILNKWKKHLETYIIILHKCTNNYDHMLCCSWDMACVRCNCYFSFWGIFCPFTPLTAQKIKIKKKKKKEKNSWRYHHFTYVYQKLWSDGVQFLRYGVQWTDRRHIQVGVPLKKLNFLGT